MDFPFLLLSISQYLEFRIYDYYFWVGFPLSAVKYFSKFGILHLRMPFWVGFPVSAVKYFSKLKFCIYDCRFGLDFPFPLLSISQNWNSAFMIVLLGWISSSYRVNLQAYCTCNLNLYSILIPIAHCKLAISRWHMV